MVSLWAAVRSNSGTNSSSDDLMPVALKSLSSAALARPACRSKTASAILADATNKRRFMGPLLSNPRYASQQGASMEPAGDNSGNRALTPI
jgi:hypothetical protein